MAKKILYGIALFIVFLMALGLAINTIGIRVGVSNPLNTPIILITFWISVLIFLGINKKRIYNWIKSWGKIHKSIYILILLPIMAIAGTELVNYTHNNILLMIMLPLIVVVPIVCLFTKLIPKKYWAFAVWMMALAVILHRSLVSPNLVGTDNIMELRCFYAVYNNEVWRSISAWYVGYNTVLSITILPAMITRIFGISGVWVFKLIFPVLLSLVPVTMYELIRERFNEKVAFLSAFVIMSIFTYFTIMIMTDKQLVATFLLSVFLLMLLDKYNIYLLGLLGLGIIVSHYSTAILFIILFMGVAVISRKKGLIILSCILAVIGIAWYKLIESGVVASDMANISSVITYQTTTNTITNPPSVIVRLFTQGIIYMPLPLLILYVISQILVVCGFVLVMWRYFIKKIHDIRIEYLALSFMLLALLGLEVVPMVSNMLGLDRVYLDCMMILTPFMFWLIAKYKHWVLVGVIFTGLFFLLNIGFINQLIGKPLSNSIALNYNADDSVITSKELDGAKWIYNYTDQPIYSDSYGQFVFYYLNVPTEGVWDRVQKHLMVYNLDNNNPLVYNEIKEGSYIYLRKFNIESDTLTMHYYNFNYEDTIEFPISSLGKFAQVISTAKIVYENSDCRIVQTTEGYQ